MPFGLKNAPSKFKEYDSFVAIFIDDILVYRENKKKHVGHLQLVFKKFEHGIIISKPKIQLFQTTIEFLGVVIGK